MNGRAIWLVTACAASMTLSCGDKDGDTGGHPARATVQITSPMNEAFVDEGDPVTLSAQATGADGATATIDSATWTAGDWSAEGNDITVTDLPAGTLDLSVEAVVDGHPLTDSIVLYVYANTGHRRSD